MQDEERREQHRGQAAEVRANAVAIVRKRIDVEVQRSARSVQDSHTINIGLPRRMLIAAQRCRRVIRDLLTRCRGTNSNLRPTGRNSPWNCVRSLMSKNE